MVTSPSHATPTGNCIPWLSPIPRVVITPELLARRTGSINYDTVSDLFDAQLIVNFVYYGFVGLFQRGNVAR